MAREKRRSYPEAWSKLVHGDSQEEEIEVVEAPRVFITRKSSVPTSGPELLSSRVSLNESVWLPDLPVLKNSETPKLGKKKCSDLLKARYGE